MIGTSLSHFQITAKLGEGGMGEVYRAEDSKLGRQVAIKVLPEAVAQEPERLARFEREAKVLASLNHPNIAAIYQVEQDDETHFLVMELVEGEDLKERLTRGQISIEDALPIGLQIAEALEVAHDNGIVHRDLKPANVKVTPDGQVKVLDFGLAKAFDSTTDSSSGRLESSERAAITVAGDFNLSVSPTLTAQMTGAGVILGTAAYMSPEQARGKPVDKRADVWAFGVLLWEMLTAHTLFEGETVTDVIAAVVTKEPDLAALPKATPIEVRRLLARCLRKDPRRRLPDIGAARLELQDVLAGVTPEIEAPGGDLGEVIQMERRNRQRERWVWAAVALVAAGLAAALALASLSKEQEAQVTVRFAAEAPEGWTFASEFDWPAPSPNGGQIVFTAYPTDQRTDPLARMLWVRSLESLAVRPLTGTEGVTTSHPAWSPDGRSLLFTSQGEIRKLSLTDGTVQKLATSPNPGDLDASWNDSGTIIFSPRGPDPVVYSVASSGGEPRPLTSLDPSRGEIGHNFPQFLPDGRRFLFLISSAQEENAGLYMASLERPEERQKIVDEWVRCLIASEHLLWVQDGTLLAQPFDSRKAVLNGEPFAIASPVPAWPANPRLGFFGVSSGGTLAYNSGTGSNAQKQLNWIDRKGERKGTVGAPGDFGQISLSPDGRNVALEISDSEGQYDLWVMDVARGVLTRVTATPDSERDPVWSPDSRSLAFIARTDEGAALRRKGLRASDPSTLLMDSPDEDVPESWSSDGKTIMVVRRTVDDEQSIWALSLEEGGEAEPILNSGFRVDEAQLSPDGQWLAYVSPESDQDEVYLEPFRQEGDRVRVSVNGGGQPKWRGDGKELFYTTPQGMLMAVEVRADQGRLEVSLPLELFEIRGLEGTGYDDYAVSTDGSRFLVKLSVGGGVDPQLHVVANWTALLD